MTQNEEKKLLNDRRRKYFTAVYLIYLAVYIVLFLLVQAVGYYLPFSPLTELIIYILLFAASAYITMFLVNTEMVLKMIR
jgi:fatty acid desaturase